MEGAMLLTLQIRRDSGRSVIEDMIHGAFGQKSIITIKSQVHGIQNLHYHVKS